MNVDGYFLPRHDQDTLLEVLDEIPGLVEDLTITTTRQDCLASGSMRVNNGSDEQPLPINTHSAEAADQLCDTLASWVHLVCEQRHYPHPADNALTLARWLKRNIIALALTEGAEESLVDIRRAVRRARASVDRARDPRWMQADIIEASTTTLNARGIAALARELGAEYTNLNRDRVRTLHDAGKITPVKVDEDSDEQYLYRIGDVLTAHLEHPTRSKRRASAA